MFSCYYLSSGFVENTSGSRFDALKLEIFDFANFPGAKRDNSTRLSIHLHIFKNNKEMIAIRSIFQSIQITSTASEANISSSMASYILVKIAAELNLIKLNAFCNGNELAGGAKTWFDVRQWQWLQTDTSTRLWIRVDKFENHQIQVFDFVLILQLARL